MMTISPTSFRKLLTWICLEPYSGSFSANKLSDCARRYLLAVLIEMFLLTILSQRALITDAIRPTVLQHDRRHLPKNTALCATIGGLEDLRLGEDSAEPRAECPLHHTENFHQIFAIFYTRIVVRIVACAYGRGLRLTYLHSFDAMQMTNSA